MAVAEGVAASLVGRAVAGFAIKMYRSAERGNPQQRKRDLAAAKTLNQYEITDFLDLPALTARNSANFSDRHVADFLEEPDVQAAVHELLTLRVVGDESGQVDRLRLGFVELFLTYSPAYRESEVRAVGEDIFLYLSSQCSSVYETLTKQHPETVERIQRDAHYSLLRSVLNGIERHLSAISADSPKEAATYSDFAAQYRKQLQVAHGTITPPDFERRKKVPVADIYVEPEIVRLPQSRSAAPYTIGGLTELENEVGRSVLLGDPGGGKSTASNVLVDRWAKSSRRPVPFLVVLRDFAPDGEPTQAVIAHLQLRLARYYQIQASTSLLERFLINGNALVVFDGLDELLDTSRRREMTEIVELFASRYPLCSILVTSRKVGYQQAPMDTDQFTSYEIAGFDEERVTEYTQKWFHLEEDRDEEPETLASSFLQESRGVPDLLRNPLMLALMCIIYRGQRFIPRNRPDVYERCATMLFDKWDSSRHIHVNLQAGRVVDPTLKHLAFWLLTNSSAEDGVPEADLVDETANYLLGKTFEDESTAREAAIEFVEFCRGRAWVFSDVGSTASGEPLYKFTHRTFMEYFAAFQLTRQTANPTQLARKLLPRVAVGEWDVVAQLAVQIENRHQNEGADRTLEVMLGDGRKRTVAHRGNILAFVARCLSFHQPAPSLARSITKAVMQFVIETEEFEQVFSDVDNTNPFFALCQSCSDSFEVVSDEMARCLDSYTEVGGKSFATRAWHVPSLAIIGSYSALFETRDRWRAWRDDFYARRKGAYLSAASRDDVLLRLGVLGGNIQISDFLAAISGRPTYDALGLLIQSTTQRVIADIRYISVADCLLFDCCEKNSKTSVDLSPLAAFFDSLGAPPWQASYAADSVMFNFSRSMDVTEWVEPEEPDTWYASFVCCAMLYETEVQERRPGGPTADTVRNGVFGPILGRRSGLADADSRWTMHSLLTKERAQNVRSWADGEMKFLAQQIASGESTH